MSSTTTGARRGRGVRALLPLTCVLAVLGAGGTAAQAGRQSRPAAAPAATAAGTSAPVAVAALACPAPLAGAGTTSVLTAVAPAERPAPARGQLFLALLRGRGHLLGDALPEGGRADVVTSRGEVLHADVPAGTGPVVARATGALAPGFTAGQLTRSESGLERGLAATSCSAATTDAWFVGSGAGVGHSATLHLSNPDPSQALVDVQVWGPDGPLESRSLRGLAVAPSGQRVVRLDAEVPAASYAVHVVARQGRVSSALRDAEAQGIQPLGVDWVPQAQAPAARVVVPGLMGGSGTRTLRLFAPGDEGAVVRISVLGTAGRTEPEQLDAVAVPAGRVSEVDVSEAGGRTPAALLLESDVPVTAALLVRQGAAAGDGTAPGELAWTAAAERLQAGDEAVVPYVATGTGRFAEISLTAAAGPARVRLVPLGRPARPAPEPVDVSVPAGSTVQVPLRTGVGTYAHAVLVQVLEGSGPVWGNAMLREAGAAGPLLTAVALRTAPRTVELPAVAADPRLAAGR